MLWNGIFTNIRRKYERVDAKLWLKENPAILSNYCKSNFLWYGKFLIICTVNLRISHTTPHTLKIVRWVSRVFPESLTKGTYIYINFINWRSVNKARGKEAWTTSSLHDNLSTSQNQRQQRSCLFDISWCSNIILIYKTDNNSESFFTQFSHSHSDIHVPKHWI